jgi:hypothetical protein
MALKKHKLLEFVSVFGLRVSKGLVSNAVGTTAKTGNVAFDTTENVYGL